MSPARRREVFHSPGAIAGGVRVALQTRSPVHSRVFSHAGFTLTRSGRNATTKAFMADGVRNSFTGAMPSPDQSSKHQSFTLNHLASRFGNCRVPTALMRKR